MIELAEQINKRISEYLASESISAEMHKVAASVAALPLWSDIGGCIAIKPDGSFVQCDWDSGKIVEEKNPAWQLLALVAGSKIYPELEVLLPKETGEAQQCSMCKGTGCLVIEDYVSKNIVCGQCFGLGWVTDDLISLSKELEVEDGDI